MIMLRSAFTSRGAWAVAIMAHARTSDPTQSHFMTALLTPSRVSSDRKSLEGTIPFGLITAVMLTANCSTQSRKYRGFHLFECFRPRIDQIVVSSTRNLD